jgi:hypothetical protein
MRIEAQVEDLMRRIGDNSTSRVLGGQMIGRSGDVVCDPHRTCGRDEKHGFSGLASKSMAMVYQWFVLK